MTRDPERFIEEIFHVILSPASPLLPFASAVVKHLRGSGALVENGDDLVNRVVELLRAVQDGDEVLPAALLADSPVLIASFFQNADLLPPAAPETARLGALLLDVMEIVSGGADWP